ncbi:hypothetical protein [Microbacterium sp. zg-YB36]|uniref:hypothetical protein n=1 Tax=Microbacterium sp. zg-YB36 TaxID=2969407 RepID=UPI00214D0766|nr:hypothetical protein [Microbacterium sp. zg-YB36]MDL5351214.1 hypothetical protein [Microbacterium sp. zg-YB36]
MMKRAGIVAGILGLGLLSGCAAEPADDLAACEAAYDELRGAVAALEAGQTAPSASAMRVHLEALEESAGALGGIPELTDVLEPVVANLEDMAAGGRAALTNGGDSSALSAASAELAYSITDLQDHCVEVGGEIFTF